MKSDKLIDTIIKYIEQKGIVVDESFLRRGQLFELFGLNAAKHIVFLQQNKIRISNKNYLKSVVEKDSYEQGGKFNYFTLSPAIANCYEYVGSEDYCNRFRECLTPSQFQSTVNVQVPSIPLYFTDGGKIKINNNGINTILVNYIPVNPLLDPTFNYDYDDYPIDESLIDDILELMFKTYQSKISQSVLDTASDSKETPKSIK